LFERKFEPNGSGAMIQQSAASPFDHGRQIDGRHAIEEI
jgi:hypothetical protein